MLVTSLVNPVGLNNWGSNDMSNIIDFNKEKKWMGRGSQELLMEDIRNAEANFLIIACRDHNPSNMFGGDSKMWLEENKGRFPKAGRYIVCFSCPESQGKPDYFGLEEDTLKIIHISRL